MTDPVVFNDRDPGPEIRRKLNQLGVDFANAVDNAVGPTGPAGPAGPKGDKGDTGDTGPQGIQGPKGDKGDKGDIGDTGPQGLTGPKGDQGDSFTVDAVGVEADKDDYIGEAVGFSFLATDSGLLYIIIAAGVWSAGVPFGKGETGDTGPQGPEGPQGPQGIQGIQGPKGDKGDTGDTGPQGLQGIQGPKGDTGDTGPAGTTSWAGITGKPDVIIEGDARLTNARTPTGGAGGVLSGTYPNPGFAVDMATQAELDAVAAAKQNVLVSGTNIKTVNGGSLLGSGDLAVGNVTLTGNETLTNKSLTSPALTGKAIAAVLSATNYLDKTTVNAAATGTVTLNFASADVFDLTLSGNTVVALSNLPTLSGETFSFVVIVSQGGTAYSLTWFSGVTWLTSGGTAPAAPSASKSIEYIFSTRNGTTFLGRKGAAT